VIPAGRGRTPLPLYPAQELDVVFMSVVDYIPVGLPHVVGHLLLARFRSFTVLLAVPPFTEGGI